MPKYEGRVGRPKEKEKGEEERAWGGLRGVEGCWIGCSRNFRGGPFK